MGTVEEVGFARCSRLWLFRVYCEFPVVASLQVSEVTVWVPWTYVVNMRCPASCGTNAHYHGLPAYEPYGRDGGHRT